MTMIWLRRYPTYHHLGSQFGINVSTVHRIIHLMVKYLHAYLVQKYIKWHTMRQWRSLQGFFPEWPRVVAILDGTPFRISKPSGGYSKYKVTQFENVISRFLTKCITLLGRYLTHNCNLSLKCYE